MLSLTKTILLVFLSAITSAVFAEGCATTGYQNGENYFGKTLCQKAVLSQLRVNGQLEIDGVKVNSDATINGTVEGHDLAINGSLMIKGKTTLNKVKIKDSTTIDGQTTLSDANLQNLTVNGKLNASGSQFANTTVNGSVNLRDVVIHGSLTASSKRIVLNGVDVKSIQIKKSLSNDSQTVCLEKASRVQGDIHFDVGNGKVYTIGASTILGKVIGGQVIQGECPAE